MAKVVIIAPSDVDVSDAIKLLKGAGHDVEIEEPTPKTLLHIVLGLMGPNAYGFGPGYAYAAGPQAADDDLPPLPDDEEAIEGEATSEPKGDLDGAADIDIPDDSADLDDVEFNFESVTVDGAAVPAEAADQDHTTLVVEKMSVGVKTSYQIAESTYSFWPEDLTRPMQWVDVGAQNVHTSREVEVKQGDATKLLVGRDLIDMFKKQDEAV